MLLTCVSHTAHVSYRIDVCPSVLTSVWPFVCPSHAGIVSNSKRLNLLSNCLHCLIAYDSSFLRSKLVPEFQWEHPQRGR